ncbi:hypothetical protein AB0H28_04490 [Micromonospora sp. NPDC050980]|uniref:hypothetical protein n=1 Tax=Micromonospora sp. NPDC050980 TaxID=3155161 RepID=UPI0033EC3D46
MDLVLSQRVGHPGGVSPHPVSPRRAPVPEHLVPVLAQLLTGAPDTAACRRLNMSPRTFSRRVAELLDHIGVESRFQAGVEAVRRGWVSQVLDHPQRTTAPGVRRTPTLR